MVATTIKNRFGMKLKEAAATHGIAVARDVCRDAIANKRIVREHINLTEVAASFLGEMWAEKLEAYYNGGPMALRESADAVDASNFAIIGGQLLVDIIREKFEYATQTTTNLFRVIPAGKNLDPHIVPYLSDVLDDGGKPVNQLQEYPRTQFIPQYITLAAPIKYGEICAVSLEMLKADKTGQAYDSAGSVGRRLGLFVHEQKLRVLLGIVNNFIFNGVALNTYLTAGTYINSLTDFVLANWTSINRIEQLQNQLTDPVTGKVIDIEGRDWLVTPFLKYTAKRIINATELRDGDITTGAGNQTVSANVLDNYTIYADKHARALLINEFPLVAARADTMNVFGDFKKAFYWREVEPLTTVQAAPNNIWEFTRDIALAVKARIWGVAGVWSPWHVTRAYNNAA